MSWNGHLSHGSIRSIFIENSDVACPVLQVLQVKKITGPNGEPTVPERYRVVVSDGQCHHSFMLATQRNHLITDDILVKNCIVRLDEYNTSMVRDRKIMIVLRLERLAGPQAPIGSPVGLEGGATDGYSPMDGVASAPAPAAPVHHHQYPPAPPSTMAAAGGYGASAPLRSPMPTAPAGGGGYGAPAGGGYGSSSGYGAAAGGYGSSSSSSSSSAAAAAGFGNKRGGFGGGGGAHHGMAGGAATTAASVDDVITEDMVIPIKVLSPYRHRWAIKGRVTSKGPVRTWDNGRTAGKLFKVDMADATGGEISVNCFNKAVDKFFDVFQEGRIYYVSRGIVKGANKKFATGNSAYEITLDLSSVVQPAAEQADIPRVNWTVSKIADLQDHPVDSPCTVIGVVLDVQEPVELPSKQRPGETITKRTITIGDRSRAQIDVSIWGAQKVAELEPLAVGAVVGFKNAKLGSYNGLSLSCSFSTHAELNPDTREAHELLGWYGQQGHAIQFHPLSTGGRRGGGAGGGGGGAGGERQDHVATCADVRSLQLGNGATPDFFQLKGTVTMFRKEGTIYYRSCPSEKCNKKVSGDEGTFHCEKCNQTYATCSYRYILSFTASDHTGQLTLTAFNDGAEIMLRHPAEELARWRDDADYYSYETAFDQACFRTYKFRCRAFAETYNQERRIKYSVQSLTPPDFVADSADMINKIRALIPLQ